MKLPTNKQVEMNHRHIESRLFYGFPVSRRQVVSYMSHPNCTCGCGSGPISRGSPIWDQYPVFQQLLDEGILELVPHRLSSSRVLVKVRVVKRRDE